MSLPERLIWPIAWAIMVIAAIVMAIGTADAQTVDLRPAGNAVVEWLAGLLLLVLSTLAGVATNWLRVRTGLITSETEALAAARLNDIIHRGIDFAKISAQNEVNKPGSGLEAVKFDNYFISLAASYVVRSAPDILKRFTISQDRLLELIMARLPAYTPEVPVTGGVAATETTRAVNREMGVQTVRTTSAQPAPVAVPTADAPQTSG